MTISKVEAIKRYMGAERPVTSAELIELAKLDRTAYEWMAQECAKQLGEVLEAK